MATLSDRAQRCMRIALGSSVVGSEITGEVETAMALDATEIGYLDAITPGTAAASKAVILDSSSKINVLDITSLKLGGTPVTATAGQVNFLASVTAGTAAASKAVVLDASGAIDTLILDGTGNAITIGACTTAVTLVGATQAFAFPAATSAPVGTGGVIGTHGTTTRPIACTIGGVAYYLLASTVPTFTT